MAAVRATVAAHGAQALAAVIVDERDAFYRGLAQFPIYGKGWLNRDAGLRVHLATFPNGVL
jgi:lysozyme family protein